ncbi:MAG: hypothetical protein DRN37_02015 [Thermoplasmata archaeon]|nr:MAG: hypothetical protein DRN37_02015 [Thermoplasmata archaeon]
MQGSFSELAPDLHHPIISIIQHGVDTDRVSFSVSFLELIWRIDGPCSVVLIFFRIGSCVLTPPLCGIRR